MGDWCYFGGFPDGVPTRDAPSWGHGPNLEAKNAIPYLWLAAFTEEDRCLFHRPDEEPRVALCTPTRAAIDRLRRRRAALLDAFGERFEALYDAWLAHLERSYPQRIILITFLHEGDSEEYSLLTPLRAVSAPDRGEPVEPVALDGDPDAPGGGIAVLHEIADEEEPKRAAMRRRAILVGWAVPGPVEQDEQDEQDEGTGFVWPPPPTGEEIARLDRWAGAIAVPELPHAPADRAAVIAQRLVENLPAAWAAAVPQVALQALWMRGERARVYEVAERLGLEQRAMTLAWYAGMDPEPRSERVSRAALTALRSSATSAALFAAVSLVPLVDRAVVRHAKRVAKLEARIPLALRLDAAPPAERPDGDTPPLDDPYAGQQGELLQRLTVLRGLWQAKKPRREEVERTLGWVFRELQSSIVGGTPASFAVTAQWLAAQGRRAEAERALDAGLAEGFRDNETEWVFVAAIRQFGRWSAIAPERWHTPALLDAAFMAGREGGDAANQLLSRITKPGLRAAALGAAALGAGKVPPAWRAELLACDEARAEALCKEEQLWDEGQWAIRFGRAAAVPAPSEAIDEALRAVFTGAQARVRAYVERIHTALAADSTTPDAEKIKALVEQLGDGYLAKELLVSNQPEWLDMFAPLVAESDPAAGGPLREGLAAALAKLPV